MSFNMGIINLNKLSTNDKNLIFDWIVNNDDFEVYKQDNTIDIVITVNTGLSYIGVTGIDYLNQTISDIYYCDNIYSDDVWSTIDLTDIDNIYTVLTSAIDFNDVSNIRSFKEVLKKGTD